MSTSALEKRIRTGGIWSYWSYRSVAELLASTQGEPSDFLRQPDGLDIFLRDGMKRARAVISLHRGDEALAAQFLRHDPRLFAWLDGPEFTPEVFEAIAEGPEPRGVDFTRIGRP